MPGEAKTTTSDQIERLEEAAMSLTGLAYTMLAVPDSEPRNPRIMLVDDDDGFRSMVRDWLSDEGLEDIVEASDGVEAVERAPEAQPDVILMDIRMPRMNGIEAAERIRMILPTVQIIMLSGYGDEVLKEAGEKAGVYTYLVKGSPPEVVWRTIRFAWTSKLQSEKNR
jgi:CheY-like chemotaxis protein